MAILRGQPRVNSRELDLLVPPRLRCELALWHEGEHADHVWDCEGQVTHGIWVRWGADDTSRTESLLWCDVSRVADDEVCTLYKGHDRGHSWSLRDPVMEKHFRQLLAENPAWAAVLTWPVN
ncbi:hypothetical protein [Streptomyces sp. NPDC005955]|uniref:hypothetical protein n=1 Tax=Streptomyces sp. NPDC005955 TaxID=3364738 RepID=UPI00368EE04C